LCIISKQGTLTEGERLSTVDLMRAACFRLIIFSI
jgi:hypothetical protein